MTTQPKPSPHRSPFLPLERPQGAVRTAQQVLQQQRADSERRLAEKKRQPPATPPAVVEQHLPATPEEHREYRRRYYDEISPVMFEGQPLKFDREQGCFIVPETEEVIDETRDFVFIADSTLTGLIRFPEQEGEPPERWQGLLYDGFVVPDRMSLGHLDEAKWPIGNFSGRAEDPIKRQHVIVLQDRASGETFAFAAVTPMHPPVTGNFKAATNLLRHYDRLARSHPDHYPVVRLKVGGYQSKYGWQKTPVFAVVGRAEKTATSAPDTSVAADLDDDLPNSLK